ncbi:hypothetical protein R50073_34470 [Maricurvus nonylphenolicus]|uniref:STAS domain-containing protein n=1 Tax=Maricurvus nonylphenolicus TaxID=1008307 RepID=UPI0036F3495D
MTKLVPFIGEEYLVREKDASNQSLDNAFDELEALIADEFEELDDWGDELDVFDDSSDTISAELSQDLETLKQETPPTATKPAAPARPQAAAPAKQKPYTLETIDGGDGLLLRLKGKVDFSSRDLIYHFIRDIREGTTKHYDLDLAQCPLITVTGISLLLLLKEATAERKVEITLSNCQPKVYQALHWAGMDKHFLVAPV